MILAGRPATAATLLAVGAADAALLAAWSHARTGPLGWAVLCAALALNGLVVTRQALLLRRAAAARRRLDTSVAALSRAIRGEQILAEIGTGLLTAADAGTVHRLAVEGATALLAGEPDTLVVLLAPEADSLAVAAGEGPSGREVTLPEPLRARLLAGEVIGVSSIAELGVPGIDSPRAALLLPLTVNGRFFGALAATAGHALRPDLRRALETLRTQVALALDGVALTAELTVRALHDPLTGLGNRALIGERLAQALARGRRSGRRVAALLLDLNGFKLVNDTMGHEAGDELLRAIAGRLLHCVRIEDTVGRLGGDEFVVIAEDLPDLAAAARIAQRVVAAVDTPVVVAGRRLPSSASVGLALSTDASTPDELLRHADIAMYTAKRRKAGTFEVYSTPNAA